MLPIDTVLLIGPLAAIAVVAWGRWRGAEWPTIAARVVLAGAIVMIVGLTILPLAIDPLAWDLHRTRGFPTWIPLLKMREDIAEGLSARQTRQIVGNVLLFVPFGFALPLAVAWCRKVAITVAIGAALSLSIEILQMVLPFRDPDIDDVVLNATGTLIGYVTFATVWWLARRYAPFDARSRQPS